jgi:methionyl-tRNA formyltransferase
MPKQMGAIDWSQPAVVVERHLRAMQPWPKPFTFLHQPGRAPLRLLILDADPVESPDVSASPSAGSVVSVDHQHLTIRCGEGMIAIRTLQPAGKRSMSTADFLRGHSVAVGDRFGPAS